MDDCNKRKEYIIIEMENCSHLLSFDSSLYCKVDCKSMNGSECGLIQSDE